METQVSTNAYHNKLTTQNAPGEPQTWTKLGLQRHPRRWKTAGRPSTAVAPNLPNAVTL